MKANADHRVDGWRMKIGKINPTTCDYPNEFSRIAPEGVKIVAASSGASSFDRSNMSKARESRREAAQMLDEWGVDCIVAGGGPVSTLEGAEAEDELAADIQSDVSVPFTTSLKAQVDALHAMDAESLVVVTPFPPERDEETKSYLEERGFEVAAIGGVDLPQPGKVRNLPKTTAYQCAKRMVAETDADFDTVYVGCSPFGSIEHVELMERDLECPVMLSAQAQMWKAFTYGDVRPDPEGMGYLFESTWG